MITFFTTFRTFGRSERNALKSWLSLHEETEVIVFTESPEALGEIDLPRTTVSNKVTKHSSGLPLLNGLFHEASTMSKFTLLCYCNSDIILMPEFLERAVILDTLSNPCIAVSQRVDVTIDFDIDFSDLTAVSSLRTLVHEKGKVHPPYGSDIFIFPKGVYDHPAMPDLVVGRPAWDNWMIYDARKRFNRLVDITGSWPSVVHQDHPGNYNPSTPAHQVNYQYLPPRDLYTFILEYANYEWKDGKMEKRSPRDKSIKRTLWERKFARGIGQIIYWRALLKYRVILKKLGASK
jgi:hypothetical protein